MFELVDDSVQHMGSVTGYFTLQEVQKQLFVFHHRFSQRSKLRWSFGGDVSVTINIRTYALTLDEYCGLRCSLPWMNELTNVATTSLYNSCFQR